MQAACSAPKMSKLLDLQKRRHRSDQSDEGGDSINCTEAPKHLSFVFVSCGFRLLFHTCFRDSHALSRFHPLPPLAIGCQLWSCMQIPCLSLCLCLHVGCMLHGRPCCPARAWMPGIVLCLALHSRLSTRPRIRPYGDFWMWVLRGVVDGSTQIF